MIPRLPNALRTALPLRSLVIASATTLALAACAETEVQPTSGQTRTTFELPTDHAVGSPDAPVTVVEYASVVCPACANWHNTVYPEFTQKYIDSGQVRFVFREYPTPPQRLADTGFMIANCADDRAPGTFMDNLKLQFERQSDILDTYRRQVPDEIRTQYEYIAKQGGLSPEEMETCLADPVVREDYLARVQSGVDMGVNSTPTFFINGNKSKVFTVEQFDEALAPLLSADAED